MRKAMLLASGAAFALGLGCSGNGMGSGLMGQMLRESGGVAVSDAVGRTDPRVARVAQPAAIIGFNAAIQALLSHEDQAAVSHQSALALEHGKDSEPVEWQNPKTGAKAKIVPGKRHEETKRVVIVREKTVSAPPPLVLLGAPYRSRGISNLRAAPSADAAKIGALGRGEEFTAVGRTEGAPWLLVGRKGRSVGYVREDLAERGEARADTGTLHPAIDLDAIQLDGDEVADHVTAKTECRGVKIVVENQKGKAAKDQGSACRSASGGWEM